MGTGGPSSLKKQIDHYHPITFHFAKPLGARRWPAQPSNGSQMVHKKDRGDRRKMKRQKATINIVKFLKLPAHFRWVCLPISNLVTLGHADAWRALTRVGYINGCFCARAERGEIVFIFMDFNITRGSSGHRVASFLRRFLSCLSMCNRPFCVSPVF